MTPFDPNVLASSGAVALVVALSLLFLFVRGDIVSGKRYDELVGSMDKVVRAIEKQGQATDKHSEAIGRQSEAIAHQSDISERQMAVIEAILRERRS